MVAVDQAAVLALLRDVAAGRLDAETAFARLRMLPFAEVDDALVDHHRTIRQGMPEAVYGPGKTPEQCAAIVGELLARGSGPVLVTRASDEQAKATLALHPDGVRRAGCLAWRLAPDGARRQERVVCMAAGTADHAVLDEATLTLEAHGFAPQRLIDVGVSGLHRLLAHVGALQAADAIIVCAGMEGALPSVVGGLTAAPVVAVPTSVGYGASFEGVTALLSMLSSCAPGVTVVGIDNGYGAACAVVRLLGQGRERR
jgi:NCAIR mutase (PurE)-related protein